MRGPRPGVLCLVLSLPAFLSSFLTNVQVSFYSPDTAPLCVLCKYLLLVKSYLFTVSFHEQSFGHGFFVCLHVCFRFRKRFQPLFKQVCFKRGSLPDPQLRTSVVPSQTAFLQVRARCWSVFTLLSFHIPNQHQGTTNTFSRGGPRRVYLTGLGFPYMIWFVLSPSL